MTHARHEFVALLLAQLRAGVPADNAIAKTDHIVSELDARYGKEEPEVPLQDQILSFIAKATSDPFIAKVFDGIPTGAPPDGGPVAPPTDYGGNGEPAPATASAEVKGSTPRWR